MTEHEEVEYVMNILRDHIESSFSETELKMIGWDKEAVRRPITTAALSEIQFNKQFGEPFNKQFNEPTEADKAYVATITKMQNDILKLENDIVECHKNYATKLLNKEK